MMANLMCRLCSSTEQIVNVFHSQLESGAQLRLYILLATGIQIKETDTVSKMVCHRCCEIAVKLHKYRTNAVANDKLLKEKHGLPYTPPITDQEELFRVAYGMCNEKGVDGTTSQDALELLSISIKTDVSSQPCDTNTSSTLPSPAQLVNTVLCDQPNSDMLCLQQPHNNNVEVHAANVSNTVINGFITRPQLIEPQISTPKNSTEKLQNGTSPRSSKFTSKISYVHPSIKKILTENKNLVMPPKVLNSDVSPVVSLDSDEVTDWYAEQLNFIKRKLSNIVIKKVPDSSHYQIETPSSKSPQNNGETNTHVAFDDSSKSSENTMQDSSKSANSKSVNSKSAKPKIRNCRRILDSDDSDSDSTDRSELLPHESLGYDSNRVDSCIKETRAAVIDSCTKESHTAVINVPQGFQHKPIYTARKRTSRKPYASRKRPSKQSDTTEVIPQKKKRIYCNKDALTPLNKVDLPQKCPSDKKAQKAIFTSSLELTPTEPLPELVDCQNVLTTGKTLDIFMCPVCSLPCTSKRQLQDHRRTHLRCKYCKTTIKTIELMEKHLNESCFIRHVKDNIVVKLTRVDSLPSVIKEYPEAFQEFDISKPALSLYCNENIDSFKEYGINIEDTEPTIEGGGITSTARVETNNKDEVVIVSKEADVVCISDESDDEVECNAIARHKIVEQPASELSTPLLLQQLQKDTLHSTSPVESISIRGFPPLQKHLTEKEMIRSLFKKYSDSSNKCSNSAQTFTPLNNSIKYTSSNLIILEDLFSELLTYKIPVQLESQTKISARFKNAVPTSAKSTLECWVHKEPIDVIKPNSTFNFVLPIQIQPKNASISTKIAAPNSAASLVTTQPNRVNAGAPQKVTSPHLLSVLNGVSKQAPIDNTVTRYPATPLVTSEVPTKPSRVNAEPSQKVTTPNANVSAMLNVKKPAHTDNTVKRCTAAPLVATQVPTKSRRITETPQKVTTPKANVSAVLSVVPKQAHITNTVMSTAAVSATVLDVNPAIGRNSSTSNAAPAPNVVVTNSADQINTISNNSVITCSNTNSAGGALRSLFTESNLKPRNNVESVCSSNTSLTAPTPGISINTMPVSATLFNSNNVCSSNTNLSAPTPGISINTVPASATLINSNNVLISTTTQSSSMASGVIATSQCGSYNGNQVQPASFTKIAETPNNGVVHYQSSENVSFGVTNRTQPSNLHYQSKENVSVGVTNRTQPSNLHYQSKENVSFGVTNRTQPSNLVQLMESAPVVYTPVCTPQKNTIGTEIQNNHAYHQPDPVYHISKNVKNVNNFILVSNNTPQLPLLTTNIQETPVFSNNVPQIAVQTSNGLYPTSYLNTVMQAPPSYENAIQMQHGNHVSQQLSAAANMSVIPTQNVGYVRVKPFYELSR